MRISQVISQIGLWSILALLLFLSYQSKIPSGVEKEVKPESDDLDSAVALEAAEELSAEERSVLGLWRMTVYGGNLEFHQVPEHILLLPYERGRVGGVTYRSLKPEMPETHHFAGCAEWAINEDGELVIWWSNISGVRATLELDDSNKWRGTIMEVWDYQTDSRSQSVYLVR